MSPFLSTRHFPVQMQLLQSTLCPYNSYLSTIHLSVQTQIVPYEHCVHTTRLCRQFTCQYKYKSFLMNTVRTTRLCRQYTCQYKYKSFPINTMSVQLVSVNSTFVSMDAKLSLSKMDQNRSIQIFPVNTTLAQLVCQQYICRSSNCPCQ